MKPHRPASLRSDPFPDDLRKRARGKPCMVRVPGVCIDKPNHHPTTVLAHFRLAGICGVGMKPPDICGAWACSACHDAIDGRVHAAQLSDPLKLYHLEGVIRTLAAIAKDSDAY